MICDELISLGSNFLDPCLLSRLFHDRSDDEFRMDLFLPLGVSIDILSMRLSIGDVFSPLDSSCTRFTCGVDWE